MHSTSLDYNGVSECSRVFFISIDTIEINFHVIEDVF